MLALSVPYMTQPAGYLLKNVGAHRTLWIGGVISIAGWLVDARVGEAGGPLLLCMLGNSIMYHTCWNVAKATGTPSVFQACMFLGAAMSSASIGPFVSSLVGIAPTILATLAGSLAIRWRQQFDGIGGSSSKANTPEAEAEAEAKAGDGDRPTDTRLAKVLAFTHAVVTCLFIVVIAGKVRGVLGALSTLFAASAVFAVIIAYTSRSSVCCCCSPKVMVVDALVGAYEVIGG
jgi:hypothetical protein